MFYCSKQIHVNRDELPSCLYITVIHNTINIEYTDNTRGEIC